jgi:enoyl-CoA hydratase
LIREIGKSRAMRHIFTSEFITADQAYQYGLLSDLTDTDCFPLALQLSEKINKNSQISVKMAKECINQAYETHLRQGLDFEKREFWSTFATEDQKIGMQAFADKKPAEFKDS